MFGKNCTCLSQNDDHQFFDIANDCIGARNIFGTPHRGLQDLQQHAACPQVEC